MSNADFVKETTNANSMATIPLLGAVATFQRFVQQKPVGTTGISVCVKDAVGNFETGLYTLTSANLLTRTKINTSSNNGAAVVFPAGLKEVYSSISGKQLDEFLTAAALPGLGVTIPDFLAGAAAASPSASDLAFVVQGNNAAGMTLSALAAFVLARYPTVKTAGVRITAAGTVPFDNTTHHRRTIYVTVPGVTFTAPGSYASVGDDFETEIWNLSSGVVVLGAGVLGLPSGNSIPAGGRVVIRSTGGAIYAHFGAAAAPDTAAPTATSAGVANATPTYVDIVFSELMDTAYTPAASTFLVSGHTVSSASWFSNTVLRLVVSTAFVNGESARTVAYTQNGANNARDVAGNLLANFGGLAVTNGVAVAGDTQAPTLSSPTGTQTGKTTATGSVSTNEANGTLFRLASTNATETAVAIIAAALSTPVAATGVQNVNFTGLAEGTTYYAHYAHRDLAGNVSAASHSAGFTTASAGGAPAPFTVTARVDFPVSASPGNGGGYLFHDIVPTGSATVVSVNFAVSTSNTVRPTSAVAFNTNPRGYWAGVMGTYQGAWIVSSGGAIIPFSYTPMGPTAFYGWIIITDSNGDTWAFVHDISTNVGDGVSTAIAGVTTTYHQVP